MAQINLGQLVISTAGRDKGKYMLVIKILDSNYVYVADGNLRKVENPKKKKVIHLKALNKRADFIADKLETNRKIYNEEVRRALEELLDANFNESSSK